MAATYIPLRSRGRVPPQIVSTSLEAVAHSAALKLELALGVIR
ncbi:MAG TPA: hypothetical protein VGR92_12295 [Steroidobacteraceae bacterium]|nr:hypothetical protein [Steroidobacteraceae bacterium]